MRHATRVVSDQPRPRLDRRGVLGMLAFGAAVATAGANSSGQARKFPDKSKAHYQADSPEAQTFYRVNRYPAKQK
jgi:hypothetical protein